MFRVLFQARPSIFDARGGDTIQLEGTRKYLSRLGVEVNFAFSDKVDCSRYDIVHLFNLTRPESTWLQLQNAKRQGKPVCLSTIYWSVEGVKQANTSLPRGTWLRPLRCVAKATLGLVNERHRFEHSMARLMKDDKTFYSLQRKILQGVDFLLPNSQMELEQIHCDFPFTVDKPSRVVYNGIDTEMFNCHGISRDWGKLRGLEQFVLCVGRIEYRKNQLGLVRAMRDLGIPVVLIGRHGKNDKYFVAVREAMKLSDVLIEEIGHMELRSIYAAARVHVLPSFYDTPGLVSLEAAAMGCNIVTSEIGSQREYFSDMAEYCDPYDETTIALAVEKALRRPWPNESLQQYVIRNFTWVVAARQTFEAYKRVLSLDFAP